jgi:hypothetical protein
MASYLHMVRAPDDPERTPPNGKDRTALWRRQLKKASVEVWMERLLMHLAEHGAMTFNRACVELVDKTADVVHGTALDEALWTLVSRGHVEHTTKTPIKFRARRTV